MATRMEALGGDRAGRRNLALGMLMLMAAMSAVLLAATPAAARRHRRAAPPALHLRLTAGQGSITASWEVSSAHASSAHAVKGFRIRWRRHNGRRAGRWSRRVELTSSARTYAISPLAKGTYEVLVRASHGRKGAGRATVAEVTVAVGAGEQAPERAGEPHKERGGEAHKEKSSQAPVVKGAEAPREKGGGTKERGGREGEGLLPEGGAGEEESPLGGLTSASVSSKPAGPAAPAGGWSVAYADAFAGPALDGSWKANTNRQGCCGNANEIATEKPSEVKLGSEGLSLQCEPNLSEGKLYACSGVSSDTPKGFRWKANLGQTLAFQVVAKWPPRDGGEDPGWWSMDGSWTSELDFFEGWEWGQEEYFAGVPVWIGKTNTTADTVSHEAYKLKSEAPNPELGFHTYTTVLKPNDELEEYWDGQYKWTVQAPPAENTPWMNLVLTHALRVATRMTGVSGFDVRSVAVYEDGAHDGVGVENGGVAPGTSVG
jgi:hypothetical protein